MCLEHAGYPRRKAEQWWVQRSGDPVPETAARALEVAEGGGLAATLGITVRSTAGEKYDRIVDYRLGPMPEASPAGEFTEDGDVPF